ncbi:MAG: hypothetical protein Q8916_05340 [Bacteroidota bacterium]|nr:hypothetical protein [Bacteroidota bacterium]MDP4229813.1 hypothetical protein [Bacteroidota bacterium]MDP4235948.1 hypothetical protein [Bacteroidota bacterium]
MVKTLIILFPVLIVLAFIVSESHAQMSDSSSAKGDSLSQMPSHFFWTTFGLGGSTIKDDEAPIGLAIIECAQYGSNTYLARITYGTGGQENKLPHERVFDAGLLYGKQGRHNLWYGSIAIGLAYVFVTKRIFDHQVPGTFEPEDVYRAETTHTVGVPIHLQFFSKFSESTGAGIGLTICANVNLSRSFGLFLFSLVFGTF